MTSRPPLWAPMLFAVLLGSVPAQGADQCTAAFLFPVQSHAAPGVLSMTNESKIISSTVGTRYPFLGKNIQPNANCNSGGYWDGGTWISNCNVSGALASPLGGVAFIEDPNAFPANPGGFPAYGGQNDLACNGAISPAAGDYRNASWGGNSCVVTLTSGQTYRFDTLSLSEGAVLNLNGATLYARKLTIRNDYNSGLHGVGSLHANELTVTGNGRLSDARVTVYNRLEVSGNGNTGTAHFQPRYIENVAMNMSGGGVPVTMAAGNWFIRNLEIKGNSIMAFQGQSTLSVYGLRMEDQGRITSVGSRNDLSVQLHQTLEMIGNAAINGYLQARYLKTFRHQSTSEISLYFRGGSHWIDRLELGHNDDLIFDAGTAAQLYIKSDLALSDQMEVNAIGKANSLMIYHFGKVTMSGNTRLNAILYVKAGNLTMGDQAQLTGAVSAVNVTMTGNSKVTHEPFGGDWPGLCPFSTCKDIFTDPPTEGASMTPPPGVLVPPLGDLVCSKQGSGTSCTGHSGNSFGPGDHDFDDGSISNQAEIIATGVTARLYFNNLDLNNAELNPNNLPENLFIYVKGDLKIAGQNKINAVVYVAGNVKMTGNATLEGALATGGNVDISGNGDYEFDQDAVDKVDLGGNTCGGSTGGSQIDHFELSHSGQALTCNPETVVIKACADANCSRLVAEQVSASLSLTPDTASNGWVGGSQLTFSGGSTTARLHNNTAGTVTMGVAGSTPAFQHPTLCRAGGGVPSVAACTLSFADSGFLFDVPDTLANKPQQVQLKAVKKDNDTQRCVPGFASVSKPVSFWSDYVSPASNTFGSKVTVNGNAIATSQGASTTSNLSFDSKGETTLTVSYPDAGQMRLNARHDGSGDTAGLVMTGSDLFVSRPVGLCITPAQVACAAGDANCPVFKKAGETFQVDIKAMAWESANDGDICTGNLATPNFALANIALGSILVAPSLGTNATLGTTRYNHGVAANSLNSINQTVSEVGVFRMTATPPEAKQPEGSTVSTGYFGYTIPATSVPMGRFVPWDFYLVSSTVTPACGGFSYMSQPFWVQTTVQARNKQGEITQNYRDAFAKGVISLVAANNQDGVDRSNRLVDSSNRLVDPLVASWSAGEVRFNDQIRFKRLQDLTTPATLTTPEEPLRLLRLGLKVGDGETPETTFLDGRNMNPSVSGTCQSGVNCTAKQLSIPKGSDDTMIAYYGRLLASTRQGVDSAPLALPLQVQYFEGGLWRANSQDICTQISLAGGGIVFTDAEQRYDSATGDLILKDGTRIRLGLGNVAPGGTQVGFDAGETRFHFAAPNQSVPIPYEILLDKQPFSPVWLADPATADHLLGEAIFGRDRGNDRIIYRREVMP
ncbi:DUF6701 domain-containing protein [Aeromonas caviae]|uniref:DUF6701 domain-containing protein n=1 Tax=Aeromonas caviae TaxID=648 RepID=UPI002446F66F|nr:DUF6701 domain-containing protein [Aeromonas caviae]MDH0027218.1 MSHA biogenesis protein MshQ [Aeromonas caviae]MDH1078987.1 MSHA biogenesis protein MshQ [Aeromonas caviae]